MVTLIERVSRYNLMDDLRVGGTVDRVLACPIELLERVSDPLRGTLTWGPGREMTRFPDLEDATGITINFADPHSPGLGPYPDLSLPLPTIETW